MNALKKHFLLAGSAALLVLLLVGTLIIKHCSRAQSGKTARQEYLRELLGKGKPVFLSPSFLTDIPSGCSAQIPTESQIQTALGDPALFHRLHREKQFSAVLLSARESSRLLNGILLSSPLWTLTDVSPQGYLFRPAGSTPWSAPSAETIVRLHPDPTERTWWLIATAEALIAIKRNGEAEEILAMAAATKRLPSALLGARASLAASRGKWNEALTLSRQSLAKDATNNASRLIMIRSLIECGRQEEALAEARTLAQSNPNTETLFLLARGAHAANSSAEEISALRELVRIARREKLPLGASLTYLGQALARNGERGDALRAFQEAATAPELTAEQRLVIGELMNHLAPDQQIPTGK
ncbi:MAG: hypothetical protein WAN16_06135 [Chthoniobacterales bacterium]